MLRQMCQQETVPCCFMEVSERSVWLMETSRGASWEGEKQVALFIYLILIYHFSCGCQLCVRKCYRILWVKPEKREILGWEGLQLGIIP